LALGRTAYLTIGVLSLAAVGLILLVLPAAYQPYVLPGLLLVLVLTIVAPKVWERPALGVAGVLVCLVLPWGTGVEGQVASVTLPDVVASALVGLVALRTLAVGDEDRLRSWVLLPFAGVVVVGGVAAVAATDVTLGLIGFVRHTEIFAAVPAATYLSLRTRKDLWLILLTFLAIGVLEGSIGVYQYFTGTGADYGGESIRAVGTFGAYQILGMATVVVYAILVAAASFAVIQDNRRWLALLVMLALLFPLAFSLSRGAWIASTVGVVAILALSNRKKLVLLLLVYGLALGIAYGHAGGHSSTLTERFTSVGTVESSPDQSVADRYAVWQAARDMWADHLLTGVGPKNFAHLEDSYVPLSFSGGSDIVDPGGGYRRVELLSPHSLYWLVLAEQGLIGALAYAALFLSLGIVGLRHLFKVDGSPVEKIFGFACVGWLASYLTSSIYADLGGSISLLDSILLGGLAWLASGVGVDKEVPDEA
jgi:O-antigen ligase